MFFFASTPFQSKSVPPRGCTRGRRETRAVGISSSTPSAQLASSPAGGPARAGIVRWLASALPKDAAGGTERGGRGPLLLHPTTRMKGGGAVRRSALPCTFSEG